MTCDQTRREEMLSKSQHLKDLTLNTEPMNPGNRCTACHPECMEVIVQTAFPPLWFTGMITVPEQNILAAL